MPVLPAPLQTALPAAVPAADAALAQLARAALGLVQATGQPVAAVVSGPLAGGLTQFDAGGMQLVLRLAAPLPAGTPVTLSVGKDARGQPAVQVAVRTMQAVPAAMPPVQTNPAAPLPALPIQTGSAPDPAAPNIRAPDIAAPPSSSAAVVPRAIGAATGGVILPIPDGGVTSDTAPPARTAAAPMSSALPKAVMPGVPTVPNTVATPAVSPGASPTPPSPAAPSVLSGSAAAPAIATAAQVAAPTGSAPPAPATVLVAQPSVAGAPATGGVAASEGARSAAPSPMPSVPVNAQQPSAATTGSGQQAAFPVSVSPSTAPSPGPVAGMPASPTAPASAGPATAQAPARTPTVPAGTAPAMPAPTAVAGKVATVPYRAVPVVQNTAVAPQPLAQVLADPTQAAARQDSIVPLLARLAALGPRLDALPPPAAQAALRLLAMRLDLSTGTMGAKALQTAIAGAGILAKGTNPGGNSVKSALLQLRSGLNGVPGAEIEPVQAVAGRPHPPVRGDEARTVRAEPPLPIPGEEPARGLLHHTDAALSRLKLLQNASQPQDSRPGTPAAPQELRVEVPLLLGAQTGLLQLVVDREARRKDRPGERGWRMRFAMAFPQTGEVGAEVALVGRSVAVALWAEDAEMEAAMAADLEALRVAMSAEGLEANSIRMRRRVKATAQRPGRLMDSAR